MKKLLAGIALAAAVLLFPADAKAVAYDYAFVGMNQAPTIETGETAQLTLRLRNVGTMPWTIGGKVRLGTENPKDRSSAFYTANQGWLSPSRVLLKQNFTNPAKGQVDPGEDGDFTFTVTAPSTQNYAGRYRERFTPVVEAETWMPDRGMYFDIVVPARKGIFLFHWYPEQWPWAADVPVAGPYNSYDPATTRRQLQEIQDAGFDFVVVDYWPADHNSWVNAERIINQIRAEFPALQYTLMIEAYHQGGEQAIPQWTYDNIWSRWGNDPQLMKYGPRPLLTTFYPTVVGGDPRFGIITFSNGRLPTYNNLWSDPPTTVWRITSLLASFDDRKLCTLGVRSGCQTFNPEMSEAKIASQTNWALNYKAAFDLVFFYGWNEYSEGAQIEPHVAPEGYPADRAYNAIKEFNRRFDND